MACKSWKQGGDCHPPVPVLIRHQQLEACCERLMKSGGAMEEEEGETGTVAGDGAAWPVGPTDGSSDPVGGAAAGTVSAGIAGPAAGCRCIRSRAPPLDGIRDTPQVRGIPAHSGTASRSTCSRM